MSQTERGKALAAEERTEESRSFVRRVKAATRQCKSRQSTDDGATTEPSGRSDPALQNDNPLGFRSVPLLLIDNSSPRLVSW